MTVEVGRNPDLLSFNSLSEIRKFLDKRESAFYQAFVRGARGGGWQTIHHLPSGMVDKPRNINKSQGELFTGAGYCGDISIIFHDALRPFASDTIQFSVGRVETDMMRENWEYSSYYLENPPFSNHTLLRVKDIKTGEALLIDGTYGQVDHRYRRRIVIIPESDLSKYYRVGGRKETRFIEVLDYELKDLRETVLIDFKVSHLLAIRDSLSPAKVRG